MWFKRTLIASAVGGIAVWAPDRFAAEDPFTTSRVCQIQIEVSSQNLDRLRAESRTYVRANVRSLGKVFRDVGVHLKGSSGSFQNLDAKPNFTLDFDRFVPGQNFGGLTKIHLNNSVEDPTYLKEQIGSELFRAAQVPTPRVAHAQVELNGRSLGLYVLKEGFTEEFIARHFQRSDGNLYDTDEGHDVDLPMKRHLGGAAKKNPNDLPRLAAAASEPDLHRRWERLQQTLEMDRFLTFMAIELMIGHWDGYCLGRNNFRIYHDPETDRHAFLPSGMDQIFSKADLPWQPNLRGLVARAVMEIPEGRRQYAATFRKLFEDLFVSERLTRRANQLLDELRPFLPRDVFERMRGATAELCAQIRAREVHLQKRLSEPEPAVPEFRQGVALLANWKKFEEPAGGSMQAGNTPEGKLALEIVAGPRTAASWRTTVRLSAGRYRFRGETRVAGVKPLPFGEHQGASLRVSGQAQHSAKLIGTSGWEMLSVDFEVSRPDEEMAFRCELRASGGEAWFDRDSLSLVRLP